MAKAVMKMILGICFRFLAFYLFPLCIVLMLYSLLALVYKDCIMETNFLLALLSIPVFAFVFLLYKKLFGVYSVQNGIKYDFLYIATAFVFMILYFAGLFALKKLEVELSVSWVLNCIGSSFLAAFSEEIFFRAITASYLKNHFSEMLKCDLLVILISSFVFALLHFVNLCFSDFTLSNVLEQIFYSFCLGIFLAFLYLKTSHLWSCILIHFLWDLFVTLC